MHTITFYDETTAYITHEYLQSRGCALGFIVLELLQLLMQKTDDEWYVGKVDVMEDECVTKITYYREPLNQTREPIRRSGGTR